MTTSALLFDAKATLGEGAVWDSRHQRLLWVDILGKSLHVFDPATGTDRVIDVGQFIGTVVPRRAGGVMVAVYDGFAALDLDTDTLEFIADPEADSPDTRFNDGKCDPAGRFWAGTMSLKRVAEAGSLYVLDADRSVRRMVTGVTTSNGTSIAGASRPAVLAGLADSATYYFIVTAVNAAGESLASVQVAATSLPPAPPAARIEP